MNPKPTIRRPRGFALVVTLSLMILLTIIAVGLLSLASVTLRTSSQGESMARAKNNARMAMMLAIGDLQKAVGSDRAITAPSSLVDAKNPSGITGVWSPWDITESGVARSATARGDKFRQWLVSTKDGALANNRTTPPFVAAGTAGSVELLGDGALGKRREVKNDDQRIHLTPTRVAKGKEISGYAWAVIDESTKARVDLHDSKTNRPAWANVTRVGSPPVDGVKTLPGWNGFTVGDSDQGKLISLGNLSLNGSVAAKDVSICDPDVTVFSNSLMTDPVNGGLKKDLSMMSSRGLSSTEATAKLYRGSGVVTDSPPSDPQLALLANYHQLYKKLGVRDGNLRPTGFQVAARLPGRYNPYPEGDALQVARITPTRTTPTEPVLVPSVVRVDIIFSMISRKSHGGWVNTFGTERPYLLHMQYLPVVTLHNPYSVPLVFEGMRVVFKNLPVGFNFRVDGQDLSTKLVALNQMYVSFAGADTASKDFGVRLKAGTGSVANQFVTLQPGQTKLFGMPRVSPTWTWFQESPGSGSDGVNLFDWRNDKTSNFDMAPTMITPPTGGGAGFDIDWINPAALATAKGTEVSKGTGMVGLKGTETLGVKFGPYAPPAGQGSFTMSIDLLKNVSSGTPTVVKAGGIQVRYGDATRLGELLSKGTSVRFPTTRSFPEIFPKPGVDPGITVGSIYEDGNTKLKDYVKSKQFMIFSIATKTSMESFIPAKTVLAGNPASNIALIDLTRGKDPEGGVPLEMVMMPIRIGKAAIEENRALEEGYFFTGNGSLNGTSRATFYEFPVAPLQSLAQFRHANLAGSGYMPFTTYTVGESFAHPQIGTDVVRQQWTDRSVMLDHAYLANEALWDRYFLSTVADQSGPLFGATTKDYSTVLSEFFEKDAKLLNPRFVPYNKGARTTPDAISDKAAGNPSHERLAAYLMLAGGFNVNSTSVDAWRAVLSALDEADIETALMDPNVSPLDKGVTERYPMPRIRRPSDKNIDDDVLPLRQKRWQGYRRLSKAQIDELAKEIVEEVRARGPFLSLADFVNRGVGAESDLTLKGALQAAVDQTSINAGVLADGKDLQAADINLNGYKSVKAGSGNSAEGGPAFLTQGDVLSAIGSRITVRSDTFRIRSYGEARDPSGKQILAQAWCEAVVQRVPDLVDPTDSPYTQFASLNNTNKTFGRRFEIVSFRWLDSKEV
jgi:hypothetical protein